MNRELTLREKVLLLILIVLVMVLGYFGYASLLLGKGLAAASSIPNNLVQAAVGIILSVLLYTALRRVPEIHKAFWKGE